MARKRQRRSAGFKFRVALEALKEQKTLNQLASEHEVHPTQITQWKKQLLEGGSVLFGRQQAFVLSDHNTYRTNVRCERAPNIALQPTG